MSFLARPFYLGICLFFNLTCLAQAEGNQSNVILKAAISAIRSNYEKINDGNVVIETVNLDKTITASRKTKSRLAGKPGTVVELSFEPEVHAIEKIIFDHDKVLYKREDKTLNINESLMKSNNEWHSYIQGSSLMEIVADEQLPRKLPVDPREIGSQTIGRNLADLLLSLKLDDAVLLEDGNNPVGKITFRQGSDATGYLTVTYYFDTKNNFLPSKRIESFNDDLVNVLDIEYQDVLSGTAKFLKTASYKFYPKKTRISPDNESQWQQQIKYEVKELSLNAGVAAATFRELDIPDGTRVVNMIKDTSYVKGKPTEKKSWGWRSLLLVNVGILAVLATVLLRRRTMAKGGMSSGLGPDSLPLSNS